jgi:hypothetical protein
MEQSFENESSNECEIFMNDVVMEEEIREK